MSDLPQGWAAATLADVATINMGQSPQGNFTNTTGVGIPLIGGAADYREQSLLASRFTNAPTKTCSRGDIVLCIRATIGKTAFADREYCLGRGVAGLRSQIVSEWLRWKLIESAAALDAAGTGTTFRQVDKRTLEAWPMPLPPLPEQRRIVAKIDSLTGKSRGARDHLDHIPRLVEKYKQAVLAAAFRGDLTRKWRVEHRPPTRGDSLVETVRLSRDADRLRRGLRVSGRNRSVPAKVVGLVDLPADWVWATFNDCSWHMTVGHVGPMKDRYASSGIPFLRSLNVKPNRIDLSNVVYIDEKFNGELTKSQLHPGDLVIVRTGEPGIAAVIPQKLGVSNCSDLVIARLVNLVNPHFAAYYMNSDFAKTVVSGFQVGVAQQHCNVGAMSEMPIPLASAEEQEEIVRRIETAFSWINCLTADATSARRLIDRLDQAVLAKAFCGELVPQDPADEPARVLLERITAERATAPKHRRGRKAAAT